MSGREKNAPASPQEERALLRQLTRELHEAAQGARDAARDLRAARAETVDGATAAVAVVIDAGLGILSDEFRRSRETLESFKAIVAQKTTEAVEAIEDNHARLMKFEDSTALARYIVTEVFHGLAANPDFVRDVGHAMDDVRTGRNRGQVLVGTQEQLEAFVARGGDPGFVLDARD